MSTKGLRFRDKKVETAPKVEDLPTDALAELASMAQEAFPPGTVQISFDGELEGWSEGTEMQRLAIVRNLRNAVDELDRARWAKE